MIRYIAHISDIHIRTGNHIISRYHEYLEVFNSLIYRLRGLLNKDDSLIVITGDIFHNKYRVEDCGISLFKHLINGLKHIAPIIIIPGNHDFRQEDYCSDYKPLLSSLMPDDIDNLFYLDATQIFTYKNIDFSTVSIYDTLEKNCASGRVKDLPDFPINHKSDNIKIALFHGTFRSIRLNKNQIMDMPADEENMYPFEWIKDFDYGLLGDIHYRQIDRFKNRLLWGYAGSLIQQNFGEDLSNHGFLLWDVREGKVTPHDIPNRHGMMYARLVEDKWHMRYDGEYVPIEANIDKVPLNVKIIIKDASSKRNDNTIGDLLRILRENKIQYNILSNSVIKLSQQNQIVESCDIIDINSKKNLIEYISKFLELQEEIKIAKDCIDNPERLKIPIESAPDFLTEKILKRNKDIEKNITSYVESENYDLINNHRFFIKRIEFAFLLSYGANNIIEFDKFNQKTVLISGRNGIGKSALFEIICYAIWGKPIPSRYDKSHSSNFVNIHKQPSDKSYTKIEIEIDDVTYKIDRVFETNKDTLQVLYSTVYKSGTLLLRGKTSRLAVDCWIEKNIGKFENFLLCSMITQENDLDFTSYNNLDMFDNSLQLNYLNSLQDLFKTSFTAHQYILDMIKTVSTKRETLFDEVEYLQKRDELGILRDKIECKTRLIDNIFVDLRTFSVKDLTSPIPQHNKDVVDRDEYESLLKQRIILENGITHKTDRVDCTDKLLEEYDSLMSLNNDIKTNFSEEYILHELKEIKKRFSVEPLKPIGDIDASSIGVIRESLDALKARREALLLERPSLIIRSDVAVDESIINNENMKKIFDDHCNQYNLNDLVDVDTSIIPECMDADRLSFAKQEMSDINNSLDQLNADIDRVQREMSSLDVVQMPCMDEEDILSKIAAFDHTKRLIARQIKDLNTKQSVVQDHDNHRDLLMQLKERRETLYMQIKEYDSNEYNPECSVCMKQPWVIIMNKKKEELMEIEDRIKAEEIQYKRDYGRKNIENYRKRIYELRESIHRHEDEKKEYPNWLNLKTQWKLYRIYVDRFNRLNMEYKSLIDEVKNDLLKRLRKSMDVLKGIKICVKLYWIYLNQRWESEFAKVSDEIERTTKDLREREDYLMYILEFKERKETLMQELEKIRQFEHNNCRLKEIKDMINSSKLCVIEDRINEYEIYMHCKELESNKISYEELNMHKMERDSLRKEFDTILSEYKRLEVEHERHLKERDEMQMIDRFIKDLDKKIRVINVIKSNILNYKYEIYNEKIIPKIIKISNSLLKNAIPDIDFELFIELNNSAPNLCLSWYIISNDKKISFKKASGFQRFILSILVRISITFLHQNNKLSSILFIDEGFVSCDFQNLSLIPEFITSLLVHFRTVILVSHLQTIQDNMDITLTIKRKENLSYICNA